MMNPSEDSAPLTLVPGPAQTANWFNSAGSVISRGAAKLGAAMTILVVGPLAKRDDDRHDAATNTATDQRRMFMRPSYCAKPTPLFAEGHFWAASTAAFAV